jgi:biopolymer transport protein TolR
MSMTSGGKGQTSEMNVTPLIDVLLVLLIIFMVVTPIPPRGLAAMVPQPPRQDQPAGPESTVVVQLMDRGAGKDPTVKINQEDATWDSLQGRLTDVYKMRAEKVMFVKADDDVAFESVAKAIDIGHASGVEKIGLITFKTEMAQPARI